MRPEQTVARLIGVYDADGSVLGELSYIVKRRLGGAHCALCDVTHGLVRERADWRACRDRLPVAFVTFHRDDQPADVKVAAGALTPVVVAETTSGDLVRVSDPDDLERCAGSPERLIEQIDSVLPAKRLVWPAPG
jgi:hypothetical protein